MRKTILILALGFFVLACKNESKVTEKEVADVEAELSEDIAYATFGREIDAADVLEATKVMEQYKTMKAGDTLNLKMKGKIAEVCSKKGCWMKLDMGNEDFVRVTFKDYGFFMPLNAEGNVIINGKAYVTETSVEDLKHYAEDAGKSAEEIAAITEAERTYAFEADGVLLEN